MKRFATFLMGLIMISSFTTILAQEDIVRKQLDVPKVDPALITIDGQMNEAAWQNAAQVNLVTNAGYEIFANKYYRETLSEPEFDEYYARLLWSKDTLFVFIVIDEFVNDSTNLFWNGKWTGDQLFVSLSNRLAREMKGWYDGNVYAAPDGPYHLLILGDQVTLNNGEETYVPDEYRKCFNQSDSLQVFSASDFVRYATFIDSVTGLWKIEMAIYNPNVNASSKLGFNIGGSMGSTHSHINHEDAYGYYTWQPNIPNDPWGDPYGNGDPGFYNLANSEHWAVLRFLPDQTDIVRKALSVPKVDPLNISIDGVMNEAVWQDAAQVNLITSGGYEIFANKYYRENLAEPEYDELYARLLWAKDTLYAFITIDEFVNDSTNLFWNGKWTGDQLFVSLSNRLGREMQGWYDGNIYAAPDGPYHLLILGDQVTLNNGEESYIPEEYRGCFEDSLKIFNASDHVRYATFIDSLTGVWRIEMAIYNPHVNDQSGIGFNIGGSMGSTHSHINHEDAYGYYTWQPNIPNDPWGDPFGNGDPGFYNLANSEHWAMIYFYSDLTSVRDEQVSGTAPQKYYLQQNFPNPFNPTTTIRFDVPEYGEVAIKVYNSIGQLVATLVNNQALYPGSYSVQWNAGTLASGIYFYEMKVGAFSQTKKMLLLK